MDRVHGRLQPILGEELGVGLEWLGLQSLTLISRESVDVSAEWRWNFVILTRSNVMGPSFQIMELQIIHSSTFSHAKTTTIMYVHFTYSDVYVYS